jgi:protein-S-isoprenylcysteine O-methyltransferase Ste14
MVRIGQFFFRFRNYLFPLALPLVFLPGPHVLDSASAAALLGLALALTGQMVRVSTIGLEYIIRGGRQRRVYAEKLVTDGVYSHTRNPMYVGNLLIVTGVCITSNSWSCVAVGVAFFAFAYLAIISAEEQYLHRMFGEAYERYCRDVPRFLPRLSGLLRTFRESKFHWRRVLTKEYGTLVGWPARWLLVFMWSLWRDGHADVVAARLPAFATIAGLLAVGYLGIRTLKKANQLVAD